MNIALLQATNEPAAVPSQYRHLLPATPSRLTDEDAARIDALEALAIAMLRDAYRRVSALPDWTDEYWRERTYLERPDSLAYRVIGVSDETVACIVQSLDMPEWGDDERIGADFGRSPARTTLDTPEAPNAVQGESARPRLEPGDPDFEWALAHGWITKYEEED